MYIIYFFKPHVIDTFALYIISDKSDIMVLGSYLNSNYLRLIQL